MAGRPIGTLLGQSSKKVSEGGGGGGNGRGREEIKTKFRGKSIGLGNE